MEPRELETSLRGGDGNERRARAGSDGKEKKRLFLPFPSLPSSPLSLIINSNIHQKVIASDWGRGRWSWNKRKIKITWDKKINYNIYIDLDTNLRHHFQGKNQSQCNLRWVCFLFASKWNGKWNYRLQYPDYILTRRLIRNNSSIQELIKGNYLRHK